jgi:plastocyanin
MQRASAVGGEATILIEGSLVPPGFWPSLLTVHVYDTVVFVNHSSPAASYAVTAGDGSFSSPAIAPGQQWQVTFNSVGVHEYHSASSPQSMAGEIQVVDTAVSLLPTAIPAIEATVTALIKAGHTPPDTFMQATPLPKQKKQQAKATYAPNILLFAFIAGVLLCIIALSVLLFLLFKKYRPLARLSRSWQQRGQAAKQVDEDEEEEMAVGMPAPTRMGLRKKAQPEIETKVRRDTRLFRVPGLSQQDVDEEDEAGDE